MPLANTLPFLGKNNFSSSILTFNLYKLKYKYIPWSHKNHVFRTLCAHSKSEKWKKCGAVTKKGTLSMNRLISRRKHHTLQLLPITTYIQLLSSFSFFFFEDALLFVILLYFSWEHNLECICTTCYNTKNLCFVFLKVFSKN